MCRFNNLSLFLTAGICTVIFSACKHEEKEPVKEGIQRSELAFTEISGDAVSAHGNHFHGLNEGVEGESVTIGFDEGGNAISGGHLHLEADAIYKMELKAWDDLGKEVQNDYIASKTIADNYKVFLTGGNFNLNSNTQDDGATFQPGDSKYSDGTDVAGQYETTGITSYFTPGKSNQGPTVEVSFILRKLNAGVKTKIERIDWNDINYQTRFPGINILDLRFELHVEEGDGRDHIH